MTPDSMWNAYKNAAGMSADEMYAGDFSFEAKGFVGNEKLSLVLSGQKKAVFTSFATYAIDNEPLPVSGEFYVVLDNNEEARCIIEVSEVSVLEFQDVTWSMAQLEGEDQNLEEWRAKQQEYLEDEGAIVGFDFTPDMKLVFMSFNLVYSGN